MFALKILLGCIGLGSALFGVLFEKKDPVSKRLTWAGKALALLAIISFVLAGLLQLLQDRRDAEKKQQQVLEELQKQRDLLEAIRRNSVPLTDTIEAVLAVVLEGDDSAVAPYFGRLKQVPKTTHGELTGVTEFSFDSPLAPNAQFQGEEVLAASLVTDAITLDVFAKGDDFPMTILILSGHAHFLYKPSVALLSVVCASQEAQIISSNRSFLNFSDLAGKSFHLIFRNPSGLKPLALSLISKSRVSVSCEAIQPMYYREVSSNGIWINAHIPFLTGSTPKAVLELNLHGDTMIGFKGQFGEIH